MNAVMIVVIFSISLYVALSRGPAWAFVLVFLPSLILFNQLPDIPIPHLPLAAQFAPLYAILISMMVRTDRLRLKWSTVDTIIVLLLISAMITSFSTESLETGLNTFRTDILRWYGPYFLARLCFRFVEIRRAGLYVLIVMIGLLSFAALIEFRLQPYWYLHLLHSLGMGNKVPPMAYSRAGFFRVSGTVEHPIYFGNMSLVLLGMVAILARTSGVSLKNPWVMLAMFGAAGCIALSISFTPYMGLAAGMAFYLMLIIVPFSRRLLLPITLVMIGVMFAYTYHVAHTPLGDKPDEGIEGSLYIRKLIIVQSWKKALRAGPFGWGRNLLADPSDEDFDLASVDNSYMQFTMTKGWVYTTLWISIAAFFSLRMTLAFLRVRHPSQVFPLAVSTATVLGLMVSMYTVWAGALYTVIWFIILGLANTLMDLVFYPELVGRPIPVGQRVWVRRVRAPVEPPPIAIARNPYWQITDV